MSRFIDEQESELSDEYLENGYLIRPVSDMTSLEWIHREIGSLIADNLEKGKAAGDVCDLFDHTDKCLNIPELNDFRLAIIQGINSKPEFRRYYYQLARQYLEVIVGNELAMQLRINLSIQFPGDKSSLLPMHADTWSGDSPYEVVVWLPLVDCHDTKSMYIMPAQNYRNILETFSKEDIRDSDDLFQKHEQDLEFLTVKFGEVLIFDQSLPHGNIVNTEGSVRWSMNCRFKGLFTPYGDKKLGEFFEPITLKPASKRGMSYSLPVINEK